MFLLLCTEVNTLCKPFLKIQSYRLDYKKTIKLCISALAPYFKLLQNETIMTLEVYETIPEEVLAANKIVVLDLTASAPNAKTAIAVIVLDVIENEMPPSEQLIFDSTYYRGHYSNGQFEFNQIISLASSTIFRLEGGLYNYVFFYIFCCLIFIANSLT